MAERRTAPVARRGSASLAERLELPGGELLLHRAQLGRLEADQAALERVADKVGAVLSVQLAHDVRLVRLDSLDADHQLVRDALVRAPLGDELEHLALTTGEQVVATARLRLLGL